MKKEFDLLREVSRFGVNQGLSLNDPKMSSAFGLHVDKSLQYALSDPTFLNGLRVEAMFENMVESFGEVVMIKPEDTGPVRTDLPMQAPDFRIVLKDGSNWLVEVKNVYEKNAFRQRRQILNRDYRRSLNNYARATGGTLKLAVFWARWSIWTLVDPERLAPGDQKLTLDMITAMKANELAVVGDQHLGLRAPIVLRLTMDPAQTSDIDEAGRVRVTIGKAQLFCDGKEILHSHDQQIAWTVMNYSDWETSDARAIIKGDRLLAIEFESNPPELSHQGFEMVGSLSRIFARHYAQRTMSDSIITNINTPIQAEWFEALRSDGGLGRIPLWRFMMQPNYDNLLP
ncbi:hypothetical protein [Acetobacter indonesiensis]|uniref:hypothetical protein n=1 Tax=Acetobacter indonesiensis TaxID=104101 RepID=UPI0039ED125D